ncbi:cytochrome c biogenesis heme-transporting ATPase CcmA [Enterobacteriaceae bacterium ESL0689]|nr:cytochrome c biogenesis heme-transporting ATPase CcmA [Enterobacteriaceae bacterium ESL0689]
MLEIINITCERDDNVLFSEVSFTLQHGEVLQIAGHNGAGKTSLLRLLAGIARPDQGQILWQGEPLFHQRQAWYSHLHWLGHRTGIKGTMTADENLCFYHPRHSRQQRWQALAQVGMVGYEDVPVALLSAGQQRRVALARLWLTDAPFWILDEPLTALDQQGIETITTRVEQHVRQGGAVIITTHQPLRPLSVPLRTLRLSTHEIMPS